MLRTNNFEANDAFGRSSFATKLESFLSTERKFVDGSLVVSLNAPFGSGKTTFLQMWKNNMDTRRAAGKNAPMCLSLNAWEDDFCGDPLLSLIDGLEKVILDHPTTSDDKKQLALIKEATRTIGWFTLGIANTAITHWTGLNPVAAGELAEEKNKKTKEELNPDIIGLFQSKKEALQRLKNSLRNIFEKERSIFILVDELDRCRPDFAIQYLETIKHIFDIEGITFILSVDLLHLENSARTLFGEKLNFPEYYRKFAHRNIHLPQPNEEGIKKLTTDYIDRFLHDPSNTPESRKSLLDFENTKRALTQLPLDFQLTPRQIQEGFRIVGHLTSTFKELKGKLYYHSANAIIFLTYLNFRNPEHFDEILSNRASVDRLLTIIRELPSLKRRTWWAFVLSTCFVDHEAIPIDVLHSAFINHEITSSNTTLEQFEHQLSKYSPGGYAPSSSLSELARKIIELDSFASSSSL